jgi:hypothetical protein
MNFLQIKFAEKWKQSKSDGHSDRTKKVKAPQTHRVKSALPDKPPPELLNETIDLD